MAESNKYVDIINTSKASKLIDWRINPLTSVEKTALSLLIGINHTGLSVWDTDENVIYYWNGSSFLPFISNRITQVSANTTLAYNTHRIVECISANLEITLPSPIGKAGFDFIIKQGNFTNTKIISPSATIDGSSFIILNNINESRMIVSNNTNWLVI